jgi:hypothetical protein
MAVPLMLFSHISLFAHLFFALIFPQLFCNPLFTILPLIPHMKRSPSPKPLNLQPILRKHNLNHTQQPVSHPVQPVIQSAHAAFQALDIPANPRVDCDLLLWDPGSAATHLVHDLPPTGILHRICLLHKFGDGIDPGCLCGDHDFDIVHVRPGIRDELEYEFGEFDDIVLCVRSLLLLLLSILCTFSL